jgi:hypothetical protein
MKRHQKLSFWQPELTPLARVYVFKEVVVHTIFDVMENIFDENKIINSRIFNMDKTSLTVKQHSDKIIAQKGQYQVGAILLCKQGQIITSVYAASVSGFCVPPMLIYPRKGLKDNLSYGAFPGIYSIVKTKAGWILKSSVNGSVI